MYVKIWEIDWNVRAAFKLIPFQKSLPHSCVFLINMITELLWTVTTEKMIFLYSVFLMLYSFGKRELENHDYNDDNNNHRKLHF